MGTSSLLTNLNDDQLNAVTHLNTPMLVLAGAGSGKTKVLTTRIAWLISEKIISSTEFLAVTFTNKAAKEMLNRILSLLNIENKNMWIGTFHSICFKILISHYKSTGDVTIPQILDSNEQLSYIKKLLKHRKHEDDNIAKEVQRFINKQKELGFRSKDLSTTNYRHKEWIQVYKEYEDLCIKQHLVDFTELLLKCVELLSSNIELKNYYSNQFKHILVDEFQDTNDLQYKFLELIGHNCNNIFVVGDEDQSIYSFRGAKVANMQRFLKDFNISNPIRLEQNYRSTQNILIAANTLINNNNNRIGKNLWTNKLKDEKIGLFEGYTEEAEAFFVVDEIKKFYKRGVPYSKIAILYRSNAQSRVFEQIFKLYGIPHKIYGGLKFFDRTEIKHIIAYLKLAYNYNDIDSFNRIINVPPRGVGAKTLEKIHAITKEKNISLIEATKFIKGKTGLNLKTFYDFITMVPNKANQLPLDELITYIIIESGIRAMYQNELSSSDRIDNLNEFIITAKGFSSINEQNSVQLFISNFILEFGENSVNLEGECVQLMTVHASKGLEFNVVFIAGLEDGLFPHENSLNEDGLEEERRLMYVAITRATNKLFLLRAFSRLKWGKRISSPISRFVNEIPGTLIDDISNMSNIKNTLIDNVEVNDKTFFSDPETKIPYVHIAEQQLYLKVGDVISHEKFGNGKILKLNIDNAKITAEILFVGLGKKVLNLNIAKINKEF